MISQNADPVSPTPPRRFRFDRYVLDVEAGCLFRDGSEIPLRPKTFSVLQHLVENPGRLVSKDELFAAVWSGIAVTDDVLVQSIGELRRSLGDDGSRLIRTIPRRGYRLDADCVPLTAVTAESDIVTPAAPAMPSHAVADVRPSRSSLGAMLMRTRGWTSAMAAALALLAIGAAVWLSLDDNRSPRNDGRTGTQQTSDAAIAARPTIAVLPFLDHDGEGARPYFADGLTQDVINALGRFSALTVMSWNAVQASKGKSVPAADIGRARAVRYYVEGKVQQADGRVRVTARLVDADGRVLWSDRFDEALRDVFALQDRMVTQIAGALAIRVTEIEQRRSLAKPTDSLEAYDHVLRARPALQRPTRAGNVEARALLRRAVELDPDYAAAHAALAETYYIDVSMGWAQSPIASLRRAEEMAGKALSLDSTEARASVILGRVHIFYHRYEQAKAELDRAVSINPSDAQGIAGRGNILMWLGQIDAAIEALELAQRIDSQLSAIDTFALSLAYYLKRRYDASIEQAVLNLRQAQGAHFARAVLAAAYAQKDHREDAERVAAELRRTDPTFDPAAFGSKLLRPADLEHLRDGFRKAGL